MTANIARITRSNIPDPHRILRQMILILLFILVKLKTEQYITSHQIQNQVPRRQTSTNAEMELLETLKSSQINY